MDETSVVALEDVSFTYDADPILTQVRVRVLADEFVAVIGPNGGGKTTLLKLVLGLLAPSSGRVRVFGASPDRSRNRVGYVPQHVSFDPKFPVTVMDVVLMGRLKRSGVGPFRRSDVEAAQTALGSVGLYSLRMRQFSDLSGGQRQRVLIARAIVGQPQLLVLDEPTANVDRQAQKQLYELLYSLNDYLTIVMASHDIGFVSSSVSKVICVNRTAVIHPTSELDGRLIAELYSGDVCVVHHDIENEEI